MHREIIFAPEIRRLRSELLLTRGESQGAEHCLRQAIELARGRSERSERFETKDVREARALLDAIA
jgi:hypothetical protein